MELKKLKVLMDLEMMRLELIPFSVNAQDVIAGWPEEKKRRFFRKFRKIARKLLVTLQSGNLLFTAAEQAQNARCGSRAALSSCLTARHHFTTNTVQILSRAEDSNSGVLLRGEV